MKNVASVLLTPSWVTASTIEMTVIHDKVITAKALCTNVAPTVHGQKVPTFKADCKTYGIK